MGPGLSFRSFAAWLAVLLTGLASTATAQAVTPKEHISDPETHHTSPLMSAYWAVVAQYKSGDRNEALVKIGAWNEKDLASVLDSTEDLAKVAAKCKACEAGQRFLALPLKAAILLHAQRDRADRMVRIKEGDGEPDCSALAHALAGERLVKVVGLQPGGDGFAARFSVAMSLDFRSMLCFLGALRWAEFGLKTAPKDADLLVAYGQAAETIGVTGYVERKLSYDTRGRPYVAGPDQVDKTKRLNDARSAFERALAVDPDFQEARVRLGRVLWRLGRGREAEEVLRGAMSGKESVTLYLGHLFLGQCLEDRQDLNGAGDEYKAALSLRPDTQIAAVALAHVLFLKGDAEGARAALGSTLEFAGLRKVVDPFWLYLTGPPDPPLFDALRLEAVR